MLKCPNCGSTEYDTVESWGGDGDTLEQLCICFDCDTQFIAVYEYKTTKLNEAQEID
jgi:hypothetical protein